MIQSNERNLSIESPSAYLPPAPLRVAAYCRVSTELSTQ